MPDRLAVRFGGPPDVAERLNDGCLWERASLIRDKQRGPLSKDDSRSGTAPDRRMLAPGVGPVLKKLDQKPSVVLATQQPLGAREGACLVHLLGGVAAGTLGDALLDERAGGRLDDLGRAVHRF